MIKLLLQYPKTIDDWLLKYMLDNNIKSKTQAIISILTEKMKGDK